MCKCVCVRLLFHCAFRPLQIKSVCKRKVSPGSDNSSRSSAPEQTEGSGSQVIVEQGAESEGTTTTTPEDVAVTTDEESEEEEAPETQVDGETTPLVLRSENEGELFFLWFYFRYWSPSFVRFGFALFATFECPKCFLLPLSPKPETLL